MANWLVNEGPKYLVFFLWLAVNGILFGTTYWKFANDVEYFYLRAIVGSSLPWARGSAMCLNFNCMLILLPVCRNLVLFFRGCSTCCRRTLRRQLDKNVSLHIFVAYAICFFVAIHVIAHCFNIEQFLGAHDSKNGLVTTLSNPQLSTNSNYLSVNPFSDGTADAAAVVFKTTAGVTGILMTLALIIMVSSAAFVVRRSVFEVFYYTHHVFIIFYICLLLHGIGGIVRKQTNLNHHKPGVCAERYHRWGLDDDCPIPWFSGSRPATWMWVTAPILLYVLERFVRRYRAFQAVKIIKAPEDDYFTIHIRRVGDWTNALAQLCQVDDRDMEMSSKLPRLCVDGPFGAPSEDYFRYDIDLLIGTGIGITPFASILKHIWYVKKPQCETGLRKVYVVWICNEMAMFEWFKDVLDYLESQLRAENRVSFMEYTIYLTRGWDSDQARNIALHGDEYRDVITGLRQKTQFGRPQWDKLFTDLSTTHPNSNVGVFFCGSREASRELHKLCNQYSSSDQYGTRFFYNKEHF